ncbi:MAG: electron transfer flavoprotein subunit beta/FixA family protein [Planctomycetaceae bacterium]|nr:electron transfer flavoprotein subunit beta/FixA family protein [Planctomycetaceae bacterium]
MVCIKQVPDTKRITGEAMKEDGTVNRAALPAIFNPEDLNALEEALKIRDAHGGTVTVVTMGLPTACDVLREALYRGADRAILVTDRRAAASDTLATSYILSRAIAKLKADIVLCGRQAIDGDTAQVGPQLAEKMGLPLISYLEETVQITDGKITVRRNVGNGWEVVRASLPVLVTVMDTANEPRPRATKKIMKFKRAMAKSEVEKKAENLLPGDFEDYTEELKATEVEKYCGKLKDKGLLIEQVNLDQIEADLAWCGRDGSPTKVHRIQSVVLTGGEYHEFKATDEDVAKLIHELIEEHTLG